MVKGVGFWQPNGGVVVKEVSYKDLLDSYKDDVGKGFIISFLSDYFMEVGKKDNWQDLVVDYSDLIELLKRSDRKFYLGFVNCFLGGARVDIRGLHEYKGSKITYWEFLEIILKWDSYENMSWARKHIADTVSDLSEYVTADCLLWYINRIDMFGQSMEEFKTRLVTYGVKDMFSDVEAISKWFEMYEVDGVCMSADGGKEVSSFDIEVLNSPISELLSKGYNKVFAVMDDDSYCSDYFYLYKENTEFKGSRVAALKNLYEHYIDDFFSESYIHTGYDRWYDRSERCRYEVVKMDGKYRVSGNRYSRYNRYYFATDEEFESHWKVLYNAFNDVVEKYASDGFNVISVTFSVTGSPYLDIDDPDLLRYSLCYEGIRHCYVSSGLDEIPNNYEVEVVLCPDLKAISMNDTALRVLLAEKLSTFTESSIRYEDVEKLCSALDADMISDDAYECLSLRIDELIEILRDTNDDTYAEYFSLEGLRKALSTEYFSREYDYQRVPYMEMYGMYFDKDILADVYDFSVLDCIKVSK